MRAHVGFAALVLSAGCHRAPEIDPFAVATAPTDRQVDCEAVRAEKPVVLFILGQSNAANHGERPTQPEEPRVYSFHDQRCYLGSDPQPGASGDGGSPWPKLADLLIASGRAASVLIVDRAITATQVAQWRDEPILIGRIEQTIAQLRAAGMPPDVLLWHQGESDARLSTGAELYRDTLIDVLRALREKLPSIPFVVAQTTICRVPPHAGIRAAQREVVAREVVPGLVRGPDTDALSDPRWRVENCHFSTAGLERSAELWRDALASIEPIRPRQPDPGDHAREVRE